MSDNPTTSSSAKATADMGEWTVGFVTELIGSVVTRQDLLEATRKVTFAHNAALAAAYQKGRKDGANEEHDRWSSPVR